jgi:hypothetical protein
LSFDQIGLWPVNYKREGFPDSLSIIFSNSIIDTALPVHAGFDDPLPVKFTVMFHTAAGDKKASFLFVDNNGDSTLSFTGIGGSPDEIQILTGPDTSKQSNRITWRVRLKDATNATITPGNGDVFDLKVLVPFSLKDVFIFKTSAEFIESNSAKEQFKTGPYVVPNPYVGAASFEPAPFEVQGRGDRRLEFRNLPQNCTIRIYTVRGELVQTLRQDGSTNGYVPWDLRTKDNLDVAPGLYVYQVDGGSAGTSIGKFAIIK